MSGLSSIEWTDATWNPTRGCSQVSPGCNNCYAMRQAHRYSGPGLPFEGFTKSTRSGPQWTGRVALMEHLLRWPIGWRGDDAAIAAGRPSRIFVNSMSDLFHESLRDEDIDRVFAVMALAPHHTFQVLTKRAKRMREYVSHLRAGSGWDVKRTLDTLTRVPGSKRGDTIHDSIEDFGNAIAAGLPNVWLGVSAENQERADERIPYLLQTPAAVRFVSAEPLLGPINLHQGGLGSQDRINWVILGGESGPDSRPCYVAWIRSLKEQCEFARIPVFVKQFGARPRDIDGVPGVRPQMGLKHKKGGDMAEWPADLRVREFPWKATA